MLKKITFTLLLSASFILCAAEKAQTNKVKTPALENPQSWTMVVVPDIQGYIKRINNHGILEIMHSWIAVNKKQLNIRQLLYTGDIVNHNNNGDVRPDIVDLVAEEQWKAVSGLMEIFDGYIPYILCTGNHDYGERNGENRLTSFNKYFPTDRNRLTREQLVTCGKNAFGIKNLENAAYEFTAPAPDGRKFLVIVLQFAPTKEQLAWAKKVADDPRFANHFGIVLTHSYIRGDGTHVKKEKYIINKEHGGLGGEDIFKQLVYPAKNIRMVICGHICAANDWDKSVGFSMVKNSSGKNVAQMMFNTQAVGGGFSGSGGDGWLRLLEFMPDKKTIKAKTYSPFFAISPSTRHLAWKTDAKNEFTFVIE